ncbi:ribonuclease H-like domain-containing protein [Tanacetum coccineum]|uniref:Ribonuclease H-like domain-containing protein n=1 Tax=Tanacetum coccineum TaxID=301880 RepID=A0ABQ5EY10_9ASTR
MTPTQPSSYQFLDDNLDTSPIALRLLTTPTSPQQTPQTTPQATPQTTPPTPIPTPSPLNTTLPPNTPPSKIPPPPPPPPHTSQHPMITRSKVRTVKLTPNTTSMLPPPPPSLSLLSMPYEILTGNKLCVMNIKLSLTMKLGRYKARLVANGRSQQQGIDCDETFNHVVKPATIRTVLSLSVSRQWPIHQLDVKNALLHGHLTETVYMHQPPGFTDSAYPDYVCLLQKPLYGLKQASSLVSAIFQLCYSTTRTPTGMFLSQSKYAIEILERANMLKCNPCKTPVDTEKKLGPDGLLVTDPTLYRSLAGALQYLTFTRPDLSYVVQQLCLYMHDPREPHLAALKRVLRYIRGTTDLGLQLYQSSTSQLISYTDADWAGCPATRRSTSGYCVFLGDNLLSWSSKRQHTLSRSSVEAEYRGVANVVAETGWIRNLLRELQAPLFTATLVYCDKVSVVYMSANPMQHQRTKHIEIDIHFVRDKVATGHIRVLHVPSRYQYADIFTNGLPYPLFADF